MPEHQALADIAAIVDCETLGLDPDWHPIWEVALIVEDKEYCWQLPVTGRAINNAQREALELSRFRDRYKGSAAASPTHLVCVEIQRLTINRPLIGAVPSFDEERLRRLMWANSITPVWHYQLVDVETMAVGWLLGSKAEVPGWPWDSAALSKQLGVDPEQFDRHTALGDCRWARAMLEAMIG